MSPVVSLIVPNYNHKHSLPVLLDSVLLQSLASLEVIIVDDKSDESCADVVDAYRARGMDIRLVALAERKYTKNARLAGIRAAKGDIIAFADADDTLLGRDVLAAHVALLQRENADIVCFPGMLPDQEGRYVVPFEWTNPLASRLEGRDVFACYIDKNFKSHVLWNKVYTRALWLTILDVAEKSAIRHYQDDLYLTSLLLFHARRYIGSVQAGYAYRGEEKSSALKAGGQAVTQYVMLREVAPYLAENGCPAEMVRRFEDQLKLYLGKTARALCRDAVSKEGNIVSGDALSALSRHADQATFLKILMLCIADGRYGRQKKRFSFIREYLKL